MVCYKNVFICFITMKYTSEIIIKAPVEKVVQLFVDPDKMKFWQPELISIEHISGEPGKPGSKNLLYFKKGRRKAALIETIHVNKLPEAFIATYETKGVFNRMRAEFSPVRNNTKTRIKTYNEFQLSGHLKLMAWLMPNTFKKQSQKSLVLLKQYIEGRSS